MALVIMLGAMRAWLLEAENAFLKARNGELEEKLERMARRQEKLERRIYARFFHPIA